MEEQNAPQETVRKSRLKKWLARLGIAGFLFFLIKGLVWVAIFLFAAKGCE